MDEHKITIDPDDFLAMLENTDNSEQNLDKSSLLHEKKKKKKPNANNNQLDDLNYQDSEESNLLMAQDDLNNNEKTVPSKTGKSPRKLEKNPNSNYEMKIHLSIDYKQEGKIDFDFEYDPNGTKLPKIKKSLLNILNEL